MLDSTGPFDYHFSRRLIALCEEHGVPHRRDTFRYYRSDAASAVEAGLELRTAWWLRRRLLARPRAHPPGRHPARHGAAGAPPAELTFPDCDTSERGPLEFPSRSVQPTPLKDVRRADD
jgi:hypothetical protein